MATAAKTVKMGIIGTSPWADIMYLPILMNDTRVDLVAICGRDRERTEAMAAKYAVPQVFTNYIQMYKQGNLDAVIIATPDDTHYEQVIAALNADLHVFCEKPVALNVRQAREMYQKAEAANLKHMVMHTWHWLPPMQRVKQLVDEGYVGKVYQGYFHWFRDYARSSAYQWRFDADRAHGILSDLGSHLIHLAQWLLGDVTAVSARLGYAINREGADGKLPNPANDTALLTLEFATGSHVQIQLSGVARGVQLESNLAFGLYGENGGIEAEWSAMLTNNIRIYGQQYGNEEPLAEVEDVDLIEFFSSHSAGPRLFVSSILENKPIASGLYQGYSVQQVIDAALESHRSGCRVLIAP